MPLTTSQRRYLRGICHQLHPIVTVAEKGVSPSIVKELDAALKAHEIVKVRISAPDRETKAAWTTELVAASRAELVQQIGHVLSLYRKHPSEPKLQLPK